VISESNIELATTYLDMCFREGKPATLVGMHWYIDGRNKLIPALEELNEALRRRPTVYIHRTNQGIEFALTGTERLITEEDLKQGYARYHEDFLAKSKSLENRKHTS
jgi:hypothetical protein